ncbi:MAG: hypothetical protein QW085_07305, partial [Pyrobaculum sp.]
SLSCLWTLIFNKGPTFSISTSTPRVFTTFLKIGLFIMPPWLVLCSGVAHYVVKTSHMAKYRGLLYIGPTIDSQ